MHPLMRGTIMLTATILIAALLVVPRATIAQTTMQHAATSPATFKVGDITITAPWARATPKGAPVAGGYLKIANAGRTPDRLIGGTFPAAGRVEVHEMKMVDGVMKMRPLAKGLEIKPGETVELKPGGYHLMFLGFKGQLKQGDTVKGTLRFEKAGTVELTYQVAPMGGPRPGGH